MNIMNLLCLFKVNSILADIIAFIILLVGLLDLFTDVLRVAIPKGSLLRVPRVIVRLPLPDVGGLINGG